MHTRRRSSLLRHGTTSRPTTGETPTRTRSTRSKINTTANQPHKRTCRRRCTPARYRSWASLPRTPLERLQVACAWSTSAASSSPPSSCSSSSSSLPSQLFSCMPKKASSSLSSSPSFSSLRCSESAGCRCSRRCCCLRLTCVSPPTQFAAAAAAAAAAVAAVSGDDLPSRWLFSTGT